MEQKIKEIINIITNDIGRRGITNLVPMVKDDLYKAAYSIYRCPNPHICIITGFYIHDAQEPAAETDGIIGTAHIARAFTNLGISVSVVTDSLCYKQVKTALQACNVEIVTPIQQIPVGKTIDEYNDIINITINKWNESKNPVTHLISIERPGTSYDGYMYNMQAKAISNYTVPLDQFFSEKTDYIKIGIGDGGNELGMGKLSRDLIRQNVRYGEFIACKTSCDYLIISAVSNWGAYGLIAVYSLLLNNENKLQFLRDFNQETDNEILINTVKNGFAVDGVTKTNSLSIDGISQDYNLKVLNNIINILEEN